MPIGQRKLRVLLVEDSPLTVQQVREMLATVAFDVQLSIEATEKGAIATALQSSPDIILLDLNLKRGSGFSVLRAVKTMRSAPTVVVLTNLALPKCRHLALLMGADYFLDKAIDTDTLPTIVESIAEHRYGMGEAVAQYEQEVGGSHLQRLQ